MARTVVTGPGTPRRTKAGAIYRVDVYQGTHTSVRLTGTGTGKIVSNNPKVVSSSDTETWIESPSTAQGREVFFYASVTFNKNNDTTLFTIDDGKAGQRAVFQVRSVPLPPNDLKTKGRLFLKLNGRAMALNQLDFDKKTKKLTVTPYEIDSKLDMDVENDTKLSGVFQQVLSVANSARLNHLVINAHGRMDPVTATATVFLGDHINIQTVKGLFGPLKDKVDYIWFQNCTVGADFALFGKIAELTRAWIAVPADFEIASIPVGKGKIDLAHAPYKFFNHPLGGDSPVGKEEFFKAARAAAKTNLDKDVAFLVDGPPR